MHLVARLRLGGFKLLDTQFVTSHLAQFGAREIPRAAYRLALDEAVVAPARWRLDVQADVLEAEIRSLAGRAPASG